MEKIVTHTCIAVWTMGWELQHTLKCSVVTAPPVDPATSRTTLTQTRQLLVSAIRVYRRQLQCNTLVCVALHTPVDHTADCVDKPLVPMPLKANPEVPQFPQHSLLRPVPKLKPNLNFAISP